MVEDYETSSYSLEIEILCIVGFMYSVEDRISTESQI